MNAGVLFRVCIVLTLFVLIAACSEATEDTASSETSESEGESEANSSEQEEGEEEEESGTFPEKEITIVVSNSAGGSNDMAARSITEPLQEILDVPVVVENVEGAGGNIARAQIFGEDPDGYTLLKTPIPSMAIGEIVEEGDFNTLDFEPVFNMFGNTSNVVIVPEDSPYETIDDLIEASESESLKASGSGTATNAALGSIFLDEMGVKHEYVPFDGGSESVQQVAGGHVDFGVASEIAAQSPVEEGLVRVIGTTANERLDSFPDAETLVENGYEDLGFEILYGFWAPPGTPEDVIETLSEAMKEASEDPSFSEAAERAGFKEKILMPDEFAEERDAQYQVIEGFQERFSTE
ncbi:tripartite tricarboxylate transporter substrate binding protein [Alteribacillus sp. YIM 98480]|uniref:Bug family tripartite tricarboxylate transporter substrate binding protein n=1 Tax=Alteribacillus sp. YIM 98480 TaxID=2606599 RepID=UPI001E2F2CAC|nr:tripartite tricarboxylate transporter substrate binding protein [Alteribacillus sp. YIM 98480]